MSKPGLSRRLRRIAYDEAAGMLTSGWDSVDMPEQMSDSEEHQIREFIRDTICAELRRKGSKP